MWARIMRLRSAASPPSTTHSSGRPHHRSLALQRFGGDIKAVWPPAARRSRIASTIAASPRMSPTVARLSSTRTGRSRSSAASVSRKTFENFASNALMQSMMTGRRAILTGFFVALPILKNSPRRLSTALRSPSYAALGDSESGPSAFECSATMAKIHPAPVRLRTK